MSFMESNVEPGPFDQTIQLEEIKGESDPALEMYSPLFIKSETTTMEKDNSREVEKPNDSPEISSESQIDFVEDTRNISSAHSPAGPMNDFSMDSERVLTREPQNSVIVPLSSVVKERCDRSVSVQSTGSCEREASPPSRRRSSRLRTERSYAPRNEEEHEEDHHDEISGHRSSEKTLHPSDGSHSNKKLSHGLKHLNICRQMNPKLHTFWDAFCWRCHKNVPLTEQHGCPSCERVFHTNCWWNEMPFAGKDPATEVSAGMSALTDNENLTVEGDESKEQDRKPSDCIECYSISDESKREDNPFKQLGPEKFKDILLYMMRFVDEQLQPDRVRPFAVPVSEQNEYTPDVKAKYAEVITHPMDLRQIAKNVEDGKYTTTASFVADLRWILHNTTIFNGQNNRYTRSAVYIVDTCQNLCCSLEWCSACFLRQMPNATDNGVSEALERGMITPCSNPHAVVWVKAEKFPLWPAIVYRFNGDTADVRFFGAFEFGTFPKEAIYLFTKNPVTDRRKGKLKIEYENALRQFRLHVAKLRMKSNKQVISYPKKTPYDGRLHMFPEDEEGMVQQSEPPHGDDENETVSVAEDDVIDADNHQSESNVYDFSEEKLPDNPASPPKTVRNSRLDILIQKAADRTKREASTESGSSTRSERSVKRSKRLRIDNEENPVARHEAIADLKPEDNREDAETAETELTSAEPVLEVPQPVSEEILQDEAQKFDVPVDDKSQDISEDEAQKLNVPVSLSTEEDSIQEADEAVEESAAAVPEEVPLKDADLPSVSSNINAEGDTELKSTVRTDTNGSSTETVKPVFDVSDTEMELPSFEMPEDSFDVKRRASTGKLDLMLKKNLSPVTNAEKPSGNWKESEGSSSHSLEGPSSSKRSPAELLMTKSVLHEALVRPFNAHRDMIQGVGLRRQKASPSMAAGQSHLIEALRASPKPGSSSDSSMDQVRKMASSPSTELTAPREEVLGRLLAAGDAQRKALVVASVRPQPTTVSHQRPILPKLDHAPVENRFVSDGRRINALSDQLNLNAVRNAQARNLRLPESTSPVTTLQRSLLARSLNTPSGSRIVLPSSFANGSNSPSTSRLPVNGSSDEGARSSSPLASQLLHNQSTMRSLLAQRSTGSPGLQALDATRNSALSTISYSSAAPQSSATAVNKRSSPTGSVQSVMQSDSIQSQIELFLRNTKKLVKDKRSEGAETTREISRNNAECIRLLQDSHVRSLQASDKMISDLQETLEQSVRKFELLFMVLQNETEFSQKAKILEVSRMKDLDRQRAITAAKRALWCCACQKRAKFICCGVTLYCSETCRQNNAPLHQPHCPRHRGVNDDGDVNTPYGVLTRCAAPSTGTEEDDLESGEGGADVTASANGAQQNSGTLQTNGWDSRDSRSLGGSSAHELDNADD